MDAPFDDARVLLAEPGQGADLTAPLLEKSGAAVVRVFSPEDLFHRLHREKVDLVVVDSRFEHPDIPRLVRDARNRARAASVGIVLASGREETALRRDALAAGATELLVRPLCPIETLRRLESAVRLRRALAHAAQLEAERLARETLSTGLVQRLSGAEASAATGWRIDARHELAPVAAGDFHDGFALGDGRIAVVAGDVLGNGPDALVRVAAVRTAVRVAAAGSDSPAGILARTHRALRAMWPEGEVVQLHVGLLDSASGALVHSAGGTDSAWILGTDGDIRPVLDRASGGPPLGAVEESDWRDARATVEAGACLLLATNGNWNARDARGEVLGRERFEEILRGAARLRGAQLLERLLDGIAEATGGAPPSDDRTLVVATRETP